MKELEKLKNQFSHQELFDFLVKTLIKKNYVFSAKNKFKYYGENAKSPIGLLIPEDKYSIELEKRNIFFLVYNNYIPVMENAIHLLIDLEDAYNSALFCHDFWLESFLFNAERISLKRNIKWSY